MVLFPALLGPISKLIPGESGIAGESLSNPLMFFKWTLFTLMWPSSDYVRNWQARKAVTAPGLRNCRIPGGDYSFLGGLVPKIAPAATAMGMWMSGPALSILR